MPIVLDRRYLENLIDILENKKYIEEETKEQMIAQGRRLIQVELAKEQGKLNGRPRKNPKVEQVTNSIEIVQ